MGCNPTKPKTLAFLAALSHQLSSKADPKNRPIPMMKCVQWLSESSALKRYSRLGKVTYSWQKYGINTSEFASRTKHPWDITDPRQHI
jgi:hypothetical protein